MSFRILMFAPSFAPYASSESIVNSKLALAILNRGWQIDVISKVGLDYYGVDWRTPWLPLRKSTHEIDYPHLGKVARTVGRVLDVAKCKHPIDGIRWASKALKYASKLHQQKGYQVVLSRATPDIAHLPAMLFARKTNVPWIANWNDPTKMPFPYGDGAQARLGVFQKRFLSKVAREANFHTFPSKRLGRYVSSYLDIDPGRCRTLPHIAGDLNVSQEYGTCEDFTVCHAGFLGEQRNPDSFLEGLAKFIDKGEGRERIKFVNIGPDNLQLRERASHFGVAGHLEVTGPLGYTETLDRLRESDLLVVIEAPCVEGIFLPSKFVDYVQTGRPILAVSPSQGTLHDILSLRGGGVSVPPGNANMVTEALDKFFSLWRQNELNSVYGSGCLYHDYSAETVLSQFENLFARVGIVR